ncbi:hypothetical protein H6G81_20445 [Scytonema hofmannii FACHB-248]|uniref:Uncharacterized protein n=1 Tax=Scytonema hofmannii FACHB-248 TaxID=1842502 RepID=A0ABR8GUL8_9CYAN|nr:MULTISPECIES: hypothetical protein [Nostocales]MBD2606835.1 hypothetical protein [Scytonema hofmannii FACHB-248]
MRGTGDQNLFVLTFYIIGVTYTFNRMVESIDDQIKFEYQKAVVEEQLKEQNIQDHVGISFKFKPSNSLDDVKELLISIENKSDNLAVYADWDNSSIVVELNKQSRRVIRKSPDLTRDLAVPQSPSLVAPKKTLSEAVTAEDVFERDVTSGTYSPKKPILNISGLEKSPVKALRILYSDFMNRRKNVEFSLQLVLRISEVRVGLAPGVNIPPMCIINCPFVVRKLPWTYALPWNKRR